MTSKLRGWIPVAIFWILFATSIGIGRRYPWLDTVWYAAGMLLLLALSVYSLVYAFRHPDASVSSKMIPRWLEQVLLEDSTKPTPPTPKTR